MSALGDLLIRLRMDTAELEGDSGRAAHVVERDMQRMLASATAAGQLIGNALTKIAERFIDVAAETLKAGDELSKLSQRTGFAVERLSELKFAGDLADVSMGQLSTSLGFFNKALNDAGNETTKVGQTFKALGVDIRSGPQQAFEQFIRAVNTLPDSEVKVAAMRIAFGRAGDALIPLISNLDETTEKARQLGLVMNDQLAKDSERFNDAMHTLAASSKALMLPALTSVAGAVATVAENLVDATTRGEKWLQVIREIAKVAAAGAAGLGIPGADAVATWMFNADERNRQRGANTGGASGGWGDDAPQIDPEAVRRATAGIKDPKASSSREKDLTAERMRMAKIQADGEEEFARQAAEAWNEYARIQVKNFNDEENRVREEIRLHAKMYTDQIEATDAWQKHMQKIGTETKQVDDITRRLGLTFTSAFEDAVSGGKKLSDVFGALLADIGKMITRLLITEPLMKQIAASFKELGGEGGALGGVLGKLFGSGYTPKDSSQADSLIGSGTQDGNAEGALLGSFATGTDRVPATGTYLLHEGEKVVRRGDNSGGGVTIHADLRGASVEAVQALQRMVQDLKAQVVSMPQVIADRNRRGGNFHAALR